MATGAAATDNGKQRVLDIAERLAMNLPEALKKHRQFLLWRYEPDPAGKKPRKIPHYTNGQRRNGVQGEPADLAQMATFGEALARLEAGGFDGVGIAMLPGAGLVGVDLDDCLAGGKINPEVAPLVAGTYCEVSPSGKGIRAFYFGEYADRKHLDAGVEIFCAKGFLTLTGDRLTTDDVIPLPDAVRSKLDALFSSQREKSSRGERMGDTEANDPIYQRLVERGMVRQNFGGGRIGIDCPLGDEHTTGDGDADCCYFLPNTNGYERGNFHCLHAHCAERSQADFLRAIGMTTEGKKPHRWGEPQPLVEKVPPAPYPIEGLPSTIRQAVEEVQSFVKAPMPLVATCALAAVSVAVQPHVDIERASKLSGPTSLNFLTVADSGERKTTCDGFFTTAIREHEKAQAELMKPVLSKYEAERRGWDAKRAGLLDAIKKASRSGADCTELDEKLIALQALEPITPRRPQILLMDQTPEALATHLANRWPSAGILSAEAGVIFGAHGMGADSVMRNLAFLNILWDGGVYDQGRKVSQSVRVESARLTLGLQIQENPLRVFFERSNGLARGTGWMARFLISWPESTMGGRMFTEAPDNWPALAQFHQRMADILKLELPVDDEARLAPRVIFLTREAKAGWVAFHDTIEGELTQSGALYDVRDLAAKAADNAARMATLFHTFRYGPTGEVGAEDFQGAVKVVAWHLNESLRFFNEIAAPPEIGNAHKLDAWLIDYCRRQGVLEVPTRTIQQFGPIRDRTTIEAAVGELAELDRALMGKEGKRRFVRVNPALIEGGAT